MTHLRYERKKTELLLDDNDKDEEEEEEEMIVSFIEATLAALEEEEELLRKRMRMMAWYREASNSGRAYIPPEKNDTTGKGIIGEEEALRLPFVMFGDRQAGCIYMYRWGHVRAGPAQGQGSDMVRVRLRKHTKKPLECKTGEGPTRTNKRNTTSK
jgi:hypothetical protein